MHSSFNDIFEKQGSLVLENRLSSAATRIQKLKKLNACLEKYEDQILTALKADLNKSAFEASVTEIFFIYGEIDFAIKHLKSWMKPKRAAKVWSNFFSKNRLYYESKGRCLIISPWNYPFQLTFSPLVSAIAAGNCAMIKPSEFSPKSSEMIAQIIAECFSPQEVACFLGNAEVSQALLELPFDHIFFTGSTAVGKIVMQAAARHLSSVTLELGGKSPAIITSDADFKKTAEKIAWGKLINCGQTCIAPDYVLIPEAHLDEFIGHFKLAVNRLYPNLEKNTDYGKIISDRHFMRLQSMVDNAVENGARLALGGQNNLSKNQMAPVLITHLKPDDRLLEEEIFGPILPVITYKSEEEALNFVMNKPKPLALYIFATSAKQKNYFLQRISAGGVAINNVLVHISNPNLPFGGVNSSGIGSSHGFYGFKNFSHEKSVLFQSNLSFNYLAYPPFRDKNWVLKLLRKIM